MKKNKFTEIKNRLSYIHERLVELEDIINEAELADTINTCKNERKNFEKSPYLSGSTVNELSDLEGYKEDTKCKNQCLLKYLGIAGISLILIYILTTI